MALNDVTTPKFTVTTVTDVLSNGIKASELQSRLESLDVNDGTAVAREVRRCNDRCHDNHVNASLEMADPKGNSRTITVAFRNDSDASA